MAKKQFHLPTISFSKFFKRLAKNPFKGGLAILISAVALVVIAFIVYALAYTNWTLPHVYVGGNLVSGHNLADTVAVLQEQLDQNTASTINVNVEGKSIDIHAADVGLSIDPQLSASTAYAVGRREAFIPAMIDLIKQLIKHTNLPYSLTYDHNKLDKITNDFAATIDQPEVNAGIKVEGGKVVETAASPGLRLDQTEMKNMIVNHWRFGDASPITLTRATVSPTIASGDTAEAIKQGENLRLAKIVLKTDNQNISPSSSTLDSWISSQLQGNKLMASVNTDQVKLWLNKVTSMVNSNVQEARLTMTNGQVTISTQGQPGLSLDIDKTADAIKQTITTYVLQGKKDRVISVGAVLSVQNPLVTDQNLNSLGIAELIGTATTSFATSPDNRKHNIAVGAGALNGILIKPGEEFSTLRYLGKIDGASGYLPELVIKEDKTTPEFGGGLCQVSTTLFRAALNSGLKITERRNHSYRVSYYEPPVGMDATIYEGSPDLKFVNDTPSYILVQSRVEGTKISFDFYGTKDGRRVDITNPVVSNVVNPPPPEYIQTDTLPEGTTKRTESAHAGADASFTYTVYNSDGSVRNNQIFNSHYQPWQARYLVGTAKTAAPTPSPSP